MKHFSPLSRQVDAVYYDKDKKECYRCPVLGISVNNDGDLQFIDSDDYGILDVPDGSNSFVGYEFDGKQENWEKDIQRFLDKK